MLTAKEAREQMPDPSQFKNEMLKKINNEIIAAVKSGYGSTRYFVHPDSIVDNIIEDLKNLGYDVEVPVPNNIIEIKW